MQIIVNDTCCLIDLRKVGLLMKVLDLPYRVAIVYPLRASELLDIPEREWAILEAGGLEVIDVEGKLVHEAQLAMQLRRGTSFNDCLSLVQTRAFSPEGVLLTNDRKLRELAQLSRIEAHGTLWLIDELLKHTILSERECAAVLEAWRSDPLVFLPQAEVEQRLCRCEDAMKMY
ncbi:MAG: type II toxin-antitoxin system VapC family toxin [Kouleothrix sp.]|nr:type II toxin-antitoxin system VapC family toxin [Kouleothrix sp.]